MVILLNHIRHKLRLTTVGSTNIAFVQGNTFEYFDELRKLLELAKSDVLFVDPYLNGEFVSRYLPSVRASVPVRLLTTKEKIRELKAAAEMFSSQTRLYINIRTSSGLHDRYLFLDRTECCHSGASFKDGAKNAPTTVTQVIDVFDQVLVA